MSSVRLAYRLQRVLNNHQKNDIKNCSCGEWGSDHGNLGELHAMHLLDELEKVGIKVVEV